MKNLKIFGVKIKINYLLLPILLLSLYFSFFGEIIITFVIIIIHELAHAMASKYYGIDIIEIELFPFGGVAKTEGYFELEPVKEIIIALAGPVVNFIMLLSMLIISYLMGRVTDTTSFFMLANLSIGVFNMLPVLPLDGGRVLRGYIGLKFGFKRATNLVMKLSKITSIFIFFIGIIISVRVFEGLLLSAIAVFLYTKVNREKERLAYAFIYQIINKKRHVVHKEIMEIKCLTALETITLKKILYEFVLYKYHFITVINNKGEILGKLTESEILDAIIEEGHHLTLGMVIETNKKYK